MNTLKCKITLGLGALDTVMEPGDILYVPSLGPAKQKLTPLQVLSYLPFVSLLRHF